MDIIGASMEYVRGVDTALLLAINGLHNTVLDTLMHTVSMRTVWIPLYLLLFAAVWRKYGWKGAIVCLIGVAMAVTLADQLCGSLLRGLAGRMRPSNPDNPISAWIHIVNGHRGGRYGFPSCHAANTAVVAVFLSMWLRRTWIIVCLAGWCLLVSVSRIFLGVHYPGDVLTGLVIGSGIAVGVSKLIVLLFVPHANRLWPRLQLPMLT